MVYFEKSQPAPECLNVEKAKAKGDYKCGEVLERLKNDFKNKCYICESKEPTSINVEHFRPHKGNKDLEFDWNNLFWSCSHCNNTKLAKFDNILNCTDLTHNVEKRVSCYINPFPKEKAQITAFDNEPETIETRDLLIAVYNGTNTELKTIESINLLNKILVEICIFQTLLFDYAGANTEEEVEHYLIKIKGHLHRGSNFTAFKRSIILMNEELKNEFEKYFE